jgi:8-oxo-dGTP pyrophosphatase MutT (NUDIX family)
MKETIQKISNQLRSKLPGLAAQQKMSPSVRHKGKSFPENNSFVKNSGVLILLYPKEGQLHTVFMKRTEYPGAHSGQISFPGGKAEEMDKNLIETATREAEEELDIKSDQLQILGLLTPLYVPVSSFKIQPVLAYQDTAPEFIPDPTEVSEVIEVAIQSLFDPVNRKTELLEKNEYKIISPYFDVHGHHIWGATAMILSELREVLNKQALIDNY